MSVRLAKMRWFRFRNPQGVWNSWHVMDGIHATRHVAQSPCGKEGVAEDMTKPILNPNGVGGRVCQKCERSASRRYEYAQQGEPT